MKFKLLMYVCMFYFPISLELGVTSPKKQKSFKKPDPKQSQFGIYSGSLWKTNSPDDAIARFEKVLNFFFFFFSFF